MVEQLDREKLKELSDQFFNFAEAIDNPERFREIGLEPSKIDEIRKRLLTLSLQILSEGKLEEGELIRSCIHILGRCSIKDKELHDSIIDCLIGCTNYDFTFAIEATKSIERLANIASPEMWEGQNRVEHLVHLIETGDDTSSWNGAYALGSLAAKVDRKSLQAHISKVLNVAKSSTGFRKAHAVTALGKLYNYADSKEEIVDTLLLAARDPDENTRRATIFALEDSISEETKDKILSCFEALLEDEAKMVRYKALEAMTEVLPHKISDKAFDRILEFLKADEQWVRWRVALALNKAYPGLDVEQRKKAASVLTELIKDEDIFVKVRAYEAFSNIRDVEKKSFPEVDEVLKEESDFVQQWVLYNSAYS
jgi:AcrR family transcriptional regulator